jgi:hypothetical protein
MNQASAEASKHINRIRVRRGGLHIDLPSELFSSAFGKFTIAAEEFVLSLSDSVYRKFAQRYLVYLQEMAQGSLPHRPAAVNGLPACTLIRSELERLFHNQFRQPAEKVLS